MASYIGNNKLGFNGGRSYSFLSQPVWVDCSFVVAPTNGLGITGLVGSGVQNVFMHTSTTPGTGNNGILNPNPASGYALIQLSNSYFKYAGGFQSVATPLSGSDLAINASALTIGNPYVITSVGVGAAGTITIAPVADTAGSLASTWFRMADDYGNNYVFWFSVAGVGSAPIGVNGTLVQVSIASGATAAQVGTALVTVLNGLKANQPGNATAPNTASFSASGTTTVTVVNPKNFPFPGGASDGVIPTGFTFALTVFKRNSDNWRAVGLQNGVTPAIGAAFIAKATGDSTNGSSTGLVQAPSVSNIGAIQVVGDPNASIALVPQRGSAYVGGWVMVQFLAPTSSSVTTPIATAPTVGTKVSVGFYMEAKSVIIAGE